MNLLRKKMLEAEEKIKKAELSLKFNPLSKKSKPLLHERELLLKILNQVGNDIDVLFNIMDEWSKTGSLTKESMQAWIQIFSSLESSLHNWNKGKAITAITFNETLANKKFHFPAMWHAQHIISTLKQHSRFRNLIE